MTRFCKKNNLFFFCLIFFLFVFRPLIFATSGEATAQIRVSAPMVNKLQVLLKTPNPIQLFFGGSKPAIAEGDFYYYHNDSIDHGLWVNVVNNSGLEIDSLEIIADNVSRVLVSNGTEKGKQKVKTMRPGITRGLWKIILKPAFAKAGNYTITLQFLSGQP